MAGRAAARRRTFATSSSGFEGAYVGGDATIMFHAYDDNRRGVVFSSSPGQTTVAGGVGQERNGVFLT